MTTAFYSPDSSTLHDMGRGHPERPERISAVLKGLEQAGLLNGLDRRQAPAVGRSALERVHDPDYVEQLFAASPASGLRRLDPDTAMNPHSLEAASDAAGAVVDAVDRVLVGDAANAFCAVRPPGHHAEYARAMGFCFFDSVAVGAAHALARHGLERIAILDFDVHHGNGTEDVLRDEPRVLFCSSYQNPLFPYTDDEIIPGKLIKSPLRAGQGSDVFRRTIERDWLPSVSAFKPQLVLVSAGFDAHRADPLAGLELEADDFAWVTERIVELADEFCDGRIVSTLEGGYDLSALAASAAAHVGVLLKRGER